MENAQQILSDSGYLFVLHDTSTVVVNGLFPPSPRRGCADLLTGSSATAQPEESVPFGRLCPSGFENISLTELHEETTGNLQIAYFGSPAAKEDKSLIPDSQVHLVHFEPQDGIQDAASSFLSRHGWHMTEHALPFESVPAESTVLVLDEMFSPLICHIQDEQFDALQQLIQRKCRILWVTVGAQMSVSLPERSLFFGVARSLHSEDPTVMVMSLDVESNSGTESLTAIDTALKRLKSVETLEHEDTEFVERDGMLYTSRIVPDNLINQSEKDSTYGPEPQVQSLHGHKSCVRLINNRTGTVDSLQYAEFKDNTLLEGGLVEVEVHAAALNFKVRIVSNELHLPSSDGHGSCRI